jgi:hypothetical protein
VGAAIVLTMMLSVITPQMTKMGYIMRNNIKQYLDRGCRPSSRHFITHKSAQHDLEELYLGPQG